MRKFFLTLKDQDKTDKEKELKAEETKIKELDDLILSFIKLEDKQKADLQKKTNYESSLTELSGLIVTKKKEKDDLDLQKKNFD